MSRRFALLAAGLAVALALGPGEASARDGRYGGYGHGGYGYSGGYGPYARPHGGYYGGPRAYSRGYGYRGPPAYAAPSPSMTYAPPLVIPGANPYPPAGADGGYKR